MILKGERFLVWRCVAIKVKTSLLATGFGSHEDAKAAVASGSTASSIWFRNICKEI